MTAQVVVISNVNVDKAAWRGQSTVDDKSGNI